jgi:hypothetical protein
MAEMTSRELVYRTIRFEETPRVPRNPWILSWANLHYPEELKSILQDFPDDLQVLLAEHPPIAHMRGEPEVVGTYVDEWGCEFTNVQAGIIGEVKDPQVKDYASDLDNVRTPVECLEFDTDAVNKACAETDKFTLSNAAMVRLFERLQFIRGTTNLFMDLMDQPEGLYKLRDQVHEWNMQVIERWCKTDVDAIGWMDDWGAQRGLLINPAMWREFFKPCYREYLDLIKSSGKACFVHSDGNIFEVYEDLIELGVDAINSQLFCMDIEEIGKRFKGRIAFWGEIDRQHILPSATVDEVRAAVRRVADALYDGHGGVFAQCEFGPGARPENVRAVYEEWDRISEEYAK